MRTERKMFDLIIDIAQRDERIRAVYMNGSRTNPNASKDIFQDYDIVYVVMEISTFLKDKNWIRIFGDLLMVQEPDKLDKDLGEDIDFDRRYTYLMLFTDGNRIDLRLQSTEAMLDEYGEDKLTVPLLDKDHILPKISLPSDNDYYVKKPTKEQFDSCTSDFWWCLQNVAKGIWRDELPYAKLMYEETTRDSLNQIVNWWIGIENDFQVSTGKMGKYFKKYLPVSYWNLYKETYSDSDYKHMWDSIFVACELFRILSKDIANHCHFSYPIEDDENMTAFLKHIKELPGDANGIY
ncbi:aminoglycoside 6-adenylyltransferase [Lysinibacillus agricola]|uniref:Aminoglycoside 6-adenylyltransferase n=1 Tax=Lysinibacillus agricola TaxID=2590012 RepID=A0ABX7ALJ4_9BACI|nr:MULTISPECIES: aminoglycoside 6-adenylyltransferase [Lysinibacillus]KOS59853.1 aminoglycoside adenylyltransferase [Lysinibacillus sp. FJAT-14222]QQP10630.1 aminoglycoside 6-adenylyltransferase [Lysinibacillus agricola]